MYTTLYKLFRAPRNRNLKRKTGIAHTIWNYFLGWQRTRYSLGLPYLSYEEMSRAFTILRKSHILKVGASTFGVENVRLAIASGS